MKDEIYLRAWRKEDASALAQIANNKKIWLNVRDRFPHPYIIDDAINWLTHNCERRPIETFAIIYNNEIVGSAGVIIKEDVYKKSIEIGYFIGEPYWGKGIATKAVQLLLAYIQKEFDVVRVFAEVFEHNRASMRVLEKSGFHLESIRKKAVLKNHVIMDDYVWVKLL